MQVLDPLKIHCELTLQTPFSVDLFFVFLQEVQVITPETVSLRAPRITPVLVLLRRHESFLGPPTVRQQSHLQFIGTSQSRVFEYPLK